METEPTISEGARHTAADGTEWEWKNGQWEIMSIPPSYQQRRFHIEREGFDDAPVYDVRDSFMEISMGHYDTPLEAMMRVDSLRKEHGYE